MKRNELKRWNTWFRISRENGCTLDQAFAMADAMLEWERN